jgi:hypothetical protein
MSFILEKKHFIGYYLHFMEFFMPFFATFKKSKVNLNRNGELYYCFGHVSYRDAVLQNICRRINKRLAWIIFRPSHPSLFFV